MLRSGMRLAQITNRHQRGIKQSIWISLALCRQREDAFSQLGPARRRSLLRSKAGPRILQCLPQKGDRFEIKIWWLLWVHEIPPNFFRDCRFADCIAIQFIKLSQSDDGNSYYSRNGAPQRGTSESERPPRGG